jgi:hypothetical protein
LSLRTMNEPEASSVGRQATWLVKPVQSHTSMTDQHQVRLLIPAIVRRNWTFGDCRIALPLPVLVICPQTGFVVSKWLQPYLRPSLIQLRGISDRGVRISLRGSQVTDPLILLTPG